MRPENAAQPPVAADAPQAARLNGNVMRQTMADLDMPYLV